MLIPSVAIVSWSIWALLGYFVLYNLVEPSTYFKLLGKTSRTATLSCGFLPEYPI